MTPGDQDDIAELESDAPEVVVEIEGTEGKDKPLTAAEGVQDFKSQMEEIQKRAVDDAARSREEVARLAAENATLLADRDTSRLETLQTAAEAVKGELAGHQKAYQEALEAGEYGKASEINVKIADAVARQHDLDRGKTALEAEGEQRKAAPRTDDPVEAYVSNFSPQSAAWLRAHPDYVTDQSKNFLVIAADAKARSERIKPDSPEYFEFIEKELGLRVTKGDEAEEAGETVVVRQPAAKRPAPVAARPSRDVPSNNGQQRPREVRLSAAEVEMAKDMGMTPAEYATSKLALQQEGKIGNNR